jgi:hypothetical protein
MGARRVRSPKFEPIPGTGFIAGGLKLRLEAFQNSLGLGEICSKPVRAGNLGLQDDRVIARCCEECGPKALFALSRIVEIPKRLQINGHSRGCGGDK